MITKLIILIILFSLKAYSQGWFEQATGLTTGTELKGVWFVNANTGFISGGASHFRIIKKTTDGGNTWVNSYFETDPATFFGLQFLNETTGYVYGYESEVYRTTNAGANWNMIYLGSNGVFSGEFLDYNTGIISGYNYNGSNIHKTTNAGGSWTTLNTPLVGQQFLYQVFFRNANTAFLTSSSYTTSVPNILRTSDGGANWSFVYTGTASQIRIKIADVNSDTMIAVAQVGNILRTYNSGLNWSDSQFGSFNFNDIVMLNAQIAYAVGQNVIVKTTNNGTNWAVQHTPSSNLQGVFFLNEQTGWACGSGGKLYKTTSGGITSIHSNGNLIPEKFDLKQNYPNPFNPSTTIEFAIPNSGVVSVKVYDVTGREYMTEINNLSLNSGTFKINFNGSNLSSGIYFYSLVVDGQNIATRRMVFVK